MTPQPTHQQLAVWLLVLGSAAFLALTARYARTAGRQTVLSCVAALAAALVFVGVNRELTFFDASVSMAVGAVVFVGYVVVHNFSKYTLGEHAEALLPGLGLVLGIAIVLRIGESLVPSEEDSARQEAISELREWGNGNFVLTYSRLHGRLKENMSFVEARPMLEKLQGLARDARVEKLVLTNKRTGADVFCTSGATQLLLKQRLFSGLIRITDGHMESLTNYSNATTISDVLVDGKSVFAE